MFKVKVMNKIASAGLRKLEEARYQVGTDLERFQGMLIRSADLHEYEFPKELVAIARAGSGTNNIPIDKCNERGIVVFNTPGANANAVKELLLANLLLSSRDLLGGIDWVKQQVAEGVDITKTVEKGKSAFIGPEIIGKSLGVIGLGAIGSKVANIGIEMGMRVLGYDPYLSVDSALALNTHIEHITDLDEVFRRSDYLTMHLHYNKSTAHIIDQDAVDKMKGGIRIINLARGGLVDDDAIIAGLESGRIAKYMTDFPNNRLVNTRNVVAMPHLGATTPESEANCASMAAEELREYLENGNINNSVNMPNLSMRRSGECRICVIHKNVPTVLSNIVKLVSDLDINVENMINKSRKELAYTVLDINQSVGESVIRTIEDMEQTIRVRVLN